MPTLLFTCLLLPSLRSRSPKGTETCRLRFTPVVNTVFFYARGFHLSIGLGGQVDKVGTQSSPNED